MRGRGSGVIPIHILNLNSRWPGEMAPGCCGQERKSLAWLSKPYCNHYTDRGIAAPEITISHFKWKCLETDWGDSFMHYFSERNRQEVSNVQMKCTFSERRLLTGPVPMQHGGLHSQDAGLWRCGALPRYERWMGVCPPAQRHNELADKVWKLVFWYSKLVVFKTQYISILRMGTACACSLLDSGDHLSH
jgi:hypothetical protein